MSYQKHTIMGACEYTIATMQNLKSDLMDFDASNPDLNWAIGGIVSALTSNLLQICNRVFTTSIANGEPDAKLDLEAIKTEFNAFIDSMVNYD